jgi:hypothetical protein
MVFTTLAHHLDEDFLTEAFHQLRKDAAAGIDEMTVEEYNHMMWKRWLARRNTKDRMSWKGFEAKVLNLFEMPKPRIVHAF